MSAEPSSPGDVRRARGRGAASNEAERYEALRREAVDDGWDLEEELAPLRTGEEPMRRLVQAALRQSPRRNA